MSAGPATVGASGLAPLARLLATGCRGGPDDRLADVSGRTEARWRVEAGPEASDLARWWERCESPQLELATGVASA